MNVVFPLVPFFRVPCEIKARALILLYGFSFLSLPNVLYIAVETKFRLAAEEFALDCVRVKKQQ